MFNFSSFGEKTMGAHLGTPNCSPSTVGKTSITIIASRIICYVAKSMRTVLYKGSFMLCFAWFWMVGLN